MLKYNFNSSIPNSLFSEIINLLYPLIICLFIDVFPYLSIYLLIQYVKLIILLGANLVLEGSLLEIFGPKGEEISFGGWLAAIGPLCFLNLIVLWIVLVLYFILPYRSFRTFSLLRLSQSSNSNDNENSHSHVDSIDSSSSDSHSHSKEDNSSSSNTKKKHDKDKDKDEDKDKDKDKGNVKGKWEVSMRERESGADLGLYDSNDLEFDEDGKINENENVSENVNMISTGDNAYVFEEVKEEAESTEIDMKIGKEKKIIEKKVKKVKEVEEEERKKEREGVEDEDEEEGGQKGQKETQSNDVYHPLQYPEWVVVSQTH